MGDSGVLGAFEELVLLALVHVEDEAYGMALRREISQRSGRDVSIGAVYATLTRLEKKGLLESTLFEEEGHRPRRTYRMLPQGREALAHTREVRARMWEGVDVSALGGGGS